MGTITTRDGTQMYHKDWGFLGAHYRVKVFSETDLDLTEDLRRIDVPTPIVHGSDEQIVPIAAAALAWSKTVERSVLDESALLEVYDDAPHGLPSTLKDRLNGDMLDGVASVRK